MQDKYRQAEDKYFTLRGQFDTGRLSQDQFDAALRALMLQDEQGRYWMIGADSGKWYYYDGANWIVGDPYPGAGSGTPPPPAASSPPAIGTRPTPPVVAASTAPPSGARSFPLVPILIALVILALAAAAFFVFMNRGSTLVAQPPAITPILPPTITRAPSPTPLNAAGGVTPTTQSIATVAPTQQALNPTLATPTEVAPSSTVAAPTNAALTTTPPVTIVVVTGAPPTGSALPTLLPTVTPQVPTALPPQPVTETPTVIAATSTPQVVCPSGVCVSKITVSAAPKRNAPVTFTTTFANATNEYRYYNLVILVFDPNKTGANKGFGESPPLEVNVPPGVSDTDITYDVVSGPGGCISLYAQAANKLSPFEKPLLLSPDGSPYSANFEVC